MENLTRSQYAARNVAVSALGHVINTAAGLACRMVFARTLSAEYLGVGSLFANILALLSLAELGVGSAVTYALYRPLSAHDDAKAASIARAYRRAYPVLGCIVAGLGLALMPFLDAPVAAPAIREDIRTLYLLHLATMVVGFFFDHRQALFAASQRQYVVTGCSYAVTIVQSILQIVCLILTKNYLAYLLIQVAGGVFFSTFLYCKAGREYPFVRQSAAPLPRDERCTLLRNIRACAISKLAGVLVNSTDSIAIALFSGLARVGAASNYALLSATLDGLVTKIFSALTGSVGHLNATADREMRYRVFKLLQFANLWLYGWGAIGIALVSGDLVRLLFGESYVLGAEIPLLIAANFFVIGMLHAVYTYKSTLGLFRHGELLLLGTAALNLGLDVLLGRSFGTAGIYAATLIARLATVFWYEPYAVYRYGFGRRVSEYARRYARYLTVLIVTGLLCYVNCELCNFSVFGNVVAKIAICSVIPNGVFALAFWRTEEFTELRQRIGGVFKRGGRA